MKEFSNGEYVICNVKTYDNLTYGERYKITTNGENGKIYVIDNNGKESFCFSDNFISWYIIRNERINIILNKL